MTKYYFLKIGARLLLWRFDTVNGEIEKVGGDGKTWVPSPASASHISGQGDGDASEITPEQARRVYSQLFPEGDPSEALGKKILSLVQAKKFDPDQLSGVFKSAIPLAWRSKEFDPDQLRDDEGKWVRVAGSPASSLMKDIPAMSSEEIKATTDRLIQENLSPADQKIYRENLAEARALLKVDPETGRNQETKQVYSKDPLGRGGYSKARLALHEDIAQKIIGGAKSYALPASGEAPTVTLLGGRPGSGKDRFGSRDKFAIGKYDESRTLKLDNDELKTILAARDGRATVGPNGKLNVGKLAGVYHAEASDLFNKLTLMARKARMNVVLDFTMSSSKQNVLDLFKKAGYKTQGLFMHVPPIEAASRAIKRTSQIGRFLDPSVILNNRTSEKYFDEALPKFDKWAVYSNDVPLGKPPRLIREKI